LEHKLLIMKNILPALAFIFSTLLSYSQQATDTLQWSESVKLSWKDFSDSPASKNRSPRQATMLMNAKFKKGIKATTTVEALFDRKSSYLPAEEKTTQTLKYYQILFDLHEAESRKLRKTFKETKLGLDPEKVFQEKYNTALVELSERTEQYIEETETGTNGAEIERWAKLIQAELKTMEAYKK